ncbi:hypothetical protein A9Q87_08685 [Flavobacteriales bacterium 34_180_T64]|nr:hypothetical protein A9Q87_08685 [Flavobacteriales bacterium 34_180_T64]
MTKISNEINFQYSGFLDTPLLWQADSILGLNQFQIPEQNTTAFNDTINSKLRLGKRVERFVSHLLISNASIDIIAENLQIQRGKLTLGELDSLINYKGKPIHLEIVYKFYLYDESVGATELEHWIGPNRKDSLINKLTKLKEKQLPNLYRLETKELLKQFNLKSEAIEQFVYFKAQLFVPIQLIHNSFKLINNECIKGIYVKISELDQLSKCKFHIPTKINWLVEIHTQIDWLSFEQFIPKIEIITSQHTAPLCWIKYPNGEVIKCFVVWW